MKKPSKVVLVGSHVVTSSANSSLELHFFSIYRYFCDLDIAAHNPKVVGSNPAAATKSKSAMQLFWEMAVKTRNFCIALFLSILLDFSRFVKGKTEKIWSCTVVQLIFVHSEI
ncbi:MAG: hypothetical protein J6O41_05950, partial [Clostridia bacterium]|nr:hypothetical protein [Clostridia bacterium]